MDSNAVVIELNSILVFKSVWWIFLSFFTFLSSSLFSLFVNGEASPLYEKGAFDRAGCLEEEIRPAQGEYVVIGDNTAESRDSRDEAVGTIRAEEIIGKVIG